MLIHRFSFLEQVDQQKKKKLKSEEEQKTAAAMVDNNVAENVANNGSINEKVSIDGDSSQDDVAIQDNDTSIGKITGETKKVNQIEDNSAEAAAEPSLPPQDIENEKGSEPKIEEEEKINKDQANDDNSTTGKPETSNVDDSPNKEKNQEIELTNTNKITNGDGGVDHQQGDDTGTSSPMDHDSSSAHPHEGGNDEFEETEIEESHQIKIGEDLENQEDMNKLLSNSLIEATGSSTNSKEEENPKDDQGASLTNVIVAESTPPPASNNEGQNVLTGDSLTIEENPGGDSEADKVPSDDSESSNNLPTSEKKESLVNVKEDEKNFDHDKTNMGKNPSFNDTDIFSSDQTSAAVGTVKDTDTTVLEDGEDSISKSKATSQDSGEVAITNPESMSIVEDNNTTIQDTPSLSNFENVTSKDEDSKILNENKDIISNGVEEDSVNTVARKINDEGIDTNVDTTAFATEDLVKPQSTSQDPLSLNGKIEKKENSNEPIEKDGNIENSVESRNGSAKSRISSAKHSLEKSISSHSRRSSAKKDSQRTSRTSSSSSSSQKRSSSAVKKSSIEKEAESRDMMPSFSHPSKSRNSSKDTLDDFNLDNDEDEQAEDLLTNELLNQNISLPPSSKENGPNVEALAYESGMEKQKQFFTSCVLKIRNIPSRR